MADENVTATLLNDLTLALSLLPAGQLQVLQSLLNGAISAALKPMEDRIMDKIESLAVNSAEIAQKSKELQDGF